MNSNEKIVFAVVFLAFLGAMAYLLMPNGIYPLTASDLMNHANRTRLLHYNGFYENSVTVIAREANQVPDWLPVSSYPEMFYWLSTYLYGFFPNAYVVISLLMVLFTALSVLGVFFIAKEIAGNKIALIAMALFAFSASGLILMNGGYVPFLMGQAFFAWAFYFYLRKSFFGQLFCVIGLWAYPYFFILYCLFLLIGFVREKRFSLWIAWAKFKYPIIASLVLLPEVTALTVFRLLPSTNKFLIKGGLTLPNLLALVAFFPALWGVWLTAKKPEFKELQNLSIAIVAFVVFLTACVALNVLLGGTFLIYHLYMPAKIAFVLFLPLSVFSAFVLSRINRALLAGLLGWHSLYFFAFVLLIGQAQSFPDGYYNWVEELHQFEEPFTVILPAEFLDEVRENRLDWFPFNSLHKPFFPESGERDFTRYLEVGRDFEFAWAVARRDDNVPGNDIFDRNGNRVVWVVG